MRVPFSSISHRDGYLGVKSLKSVIPWVSICVIGIVSSRGYCLGVARYALKVGQELNYETSRETRFDGYWSKATHHLKLSVVSENANGWRLVLRGTTDLETSGGSRHSDELGGVDLSREGNMSYPIPSYGMELNHVFPRLPQNILAAHSGWKATDLETGNLVDYRPENLGMDQWKIRTTEVSDADPVFQSKRGGEFSFDLGTGLLSSATLSDVSQYPSEVTESANIKLDGVALADPEWVAKFSPEFSTLVEYHARYSRLGAENEKHLSDIKSYLDTQRKVLTELRAKLSYPNLTRYVDNLITFHDRYYVSQTTEWAENLLNFIGKPAPEWELDALSGGKYSLKDYRGKVLLLDFWRGGCGPCIDAIPKLMAIAKDLETAPFALFGMHEKQAEEGLAAHVMSVLQVTYPVLRADSVKEKYNITALPTLFLIDKHGLIRHMEVGYRPDLEKDFLRRIKELLEE